MLLFVIHPPSFALGVVVGALIAGPLALYLVAALAVSARIGGRKP
jgi:hypothetical protein